MSSITGIAHIKEGEQSIVLSPNDLNDRIINLKFYRYSGRHFIIRSDYEPVFHRDNTISFKRCVEKPPIKISYKQVSNSTAIEINIEVTNLFIGDGDTEGEDNMFTAARMENGKRMGDPVIACEIQMGYRAQFPDWTSPQHRNDIESFYNMSGGEFYGRRVLVQILAGYQKSLPPDKITYFQGIIGTMETGLRWEHTEADLQDYRYGDTSFPQEFRELESVLYQFVTRRFIRSSVSHFMDTEQDFMNVEAMNDLVDRNYLQTVFIHDYELYKDPGADAFDRYKASLARLGRAVTSRAGVKLPLNEEGIMPVAEANKFGVICILSQTLKSVPVHELYGYGMSREEARAIRRIIPSKPFDCQIDTLGGQLIAIQAYYPFIRWYQLTDGSVYFYHKDDTDTDLRIEPFIKTIQDETTIALPAIYDMTSSGLRTIRCPFYAFASPMTTVLFQNRFTLGTLISYYYPVKTNAFLVITSTIEFSTTGDENMMELLCVDLPPGEVDTDPDTGKLIVKKHLAIELSELAELPQEGNMQWFEDDITVVAHRTGVRDAASKWENIIKDNILVFPERWPEGELPTEKDKLLALKDWNPDYFDPGKEYMKRANLGAGESFENLPKGIGGRTGIRVPWLRVGDKITVRYPFQPEYPDNEKVVV